MNTGNIVNRRCVLLVAFLSFGGLSACEGPSSNNANTSATPTPERPALRVARLEHEFQGEEEDDDEMRAEVRQAAIEFLNAKLPKWTVKGLSSMSQKDKLFWVDVDLQSDHHTAVVGLSVQKFFPESGNAYWRVTLLDQKYSTRLHDLDDAALLKKLKELDAATVD